jgi:hypothetical protein
MLKEGIQGYCLMQLAKNAMTSLLNTIYLGNLKRKISYK